MMKVVRRTIISAMPSRPSVKRIPHDGIQARSKECCQRSSAGSNDHHRPSDRTNSIAKNRVASVRGPRAAPETTSSSPSAPRRPVNRTSSAPTTGIASSVGRIQLSYPMDSRKSRIALAEAEGTEHEQHTDDEHPGVGADATGLHLRAEVADSAGEPAAHR